MMGTASATETHTARKRHRCDWCSETIEPGETYQRYRWWDGGDAGTAKMHPECLAASGEVAQYEGGWFQWMPGDFERGCGCDQGNCECTDKTIYPEAKKP